MKYLNVGILILIVVWMSSLGYFMRKERIRRDCFDAIAQEAFLTTHEEYPERFKQIERTDRINKCIRMYEENAQ